LYSFLYSYLWTEDRSLQKTLQEVDSFVEDLLDSLSSRNITDIVNIIFVSDHGMTDMSHPELIYMDDILGEDYSAIEHVDGQHCVTHSHM